MIKIVFAGDLIPVNKDSIEIDSQIVEYINNSDYSLANLEAPLTSSTEKLKKIGLNFKCNPDTVELIKYFDFKCLCLANNHILDYKEKGVIDTISVLTNNKIDFLGAGENIFHASVPLNKSICGKEFVFINLSENEFSIASEYRAGANPFSLIPLLKLLSDFKKRNSVIVLIFHGGIENYPFPSPKLREKFHFLIDIGVDCIVSHHTHLFGSFEYYKEKPIFYGIGNILASATKMMPDFYYKSAILSINFNDNNISHSLLPVKFNEECSFLKIMNERETELFYEKINEQNSVLTNSSLYSDEWNNFLKESKFYYSHIVGGYNGKIIKKLRKMRLFPLPSYKSRRALQLLNFLRCESHNEVLVEIIEKEIIEYDK